MLPDPLNHRRCTASGFSACALLCLLWLPQTLALAPSGGLSAAVPEIAAAGAAARRAFVEAAVYELARAYGALTRDAGAEQARWARGTRGYAARLEAAAAAARRGAPVRLLAEADGAVRVVVGARPARQFMVSAPVAGGAAALERAILERYCRQTGCGGARRAAASAATTRAVQATLGRHAPITASAKPAAVSMPPRPVDWRWRQAEVAPAPPRLVNTLSAGDDGLRCLTAGRPHARLQAAACTELLAEIRRWAVAVHAAARRGTLIDWAFLALPPRGGLGDTLRVNAAATPLPLALPAMGRAPALRAELLPWLKDRLYGRQREVTFAPPSSLVYAAR